jgi:methionyl-tRNA synthetase
VYEGDLANAFGNLASRTTAMVEKYFEGVVPSAPAGPQVASTSGAVHRAVAAVTGGKGFLLHEAVAHVLTSVRDTNEYVQRSQPWALAKDSARRGELAAVLADAVGSLARQAAALAPVMPGKSQELWRSLGGPGTVIEQRLDRLATLDVSGWRVSKGAPLFPKPNPTSDAP